MSQPTAHAKLPGHEHHGHWRRAPAGARRVTAAGGRAWAVVGQTRLPDPRRVGPPHISTGLLDRPAGLSRTDAASLLVDLAETRDHAREALNVRGHDQSRQGLRSGYSP